jgi:hypothetical protein
VSGVNSLTVFVPGDPSVGLASMTWTVEDVGDVDLYPSHREDVRSAFRTAFMTLLGDGERVRVWFDDERTPSD